MQASKTTNVSIDKASGVATINASPGKHPMKYQRLNEQIHELLTEGVKHIKIYNVVGQRFIGAALKDPDILLEIHGTPGNDLGIFMDGPRIEVFGNVQDQCGNTMSGGTIVIHGSSRDVAGLSARAGTIFVRGDGGYRVGVHVKEYRHTRPVLVFGGRVREFFGEYMAGGLLVALGLDIKADGSFTKITRKPIAGDSLATGIHGGKIILARAKEEIPCDYLGVGAALNDLGDADRKDLETVLASYCKEFNVDHDKIMGLDFCKVTAVSKRPFASNYCSRPL